MGGQSPEVGVCAWVGRATGRPVQLEQSGGQRGGEGRRASRRLNVGALLDHGEWLGLDLGTMKDDWRMS